MKKILLTIMAIATLSACHHKHEDPVEDKADRTVLVYIAGENSLSSFINQEITEMKTGSMTIGKNNLLVYVDRGASSELPWLARIQEGKVKDSVSIADMNISQKDELASNPEVMESVLRYAFSKYPSKNEDYGLVLWGHASGWVIESDSIPYTAMARRKAFGVDNGVNSTSDSGKWLNIPTIAKLLSKLPHLKFIFADCCNFQCLEVAYELRNVTDYVIGSPAEIPGVGAPYETVVPAMFETSTFYTSIVDKYYAQRAEGYDVPLSAIKTDAMNDLANATSLVLKTIKEKYSGDYPDMNGIIHYYYNHKFYDANDFVRTYASENDYAAWKQALDKAVVYKKSAKEWMTNRSWSGYYKDFEVTEEKYGGVSMFVPQSPYSGDYYTANTTISKMAWYYDAGLKDIGW